MWWRIWFYWKNWKGFLECDEGSDSAEENAIVHVCKTTEIADDNIVTTQLILKHNYEMDTMHLTKENQ